MNADIDTQVLSVATQVIGLGAKWLQPFDVEDTFNNNLRLLGRSDPLNPRHQKKAVIATCWNFLETSDHLSYETLLPLLAEDYEPRDMEGFRPHIEKCIRHVMHEFEFKERVVEAYDKFGVSIHADKATVMRALSKNFPRGEMKKVYAIIVGNR